MRNSGATGRYEALFSSNWRLSTIQDIHQKTKTSRMNMLVTYSLSLSSYRASLLGNFLFNILQVFNHKRISRQTHDGYMQMGMPHICKCWCLSDSGENSLAERGRHTNSFTTAIKVNIICDYDSSDSNEHCLGRGLWTPRGTSNYRELEYVGVNEYIISFYHTFRIVVSLSPTIGQVFKNWTTHISLGTWQIQRLLKQKL